MNGNEVVNIRHTIESLLNQTHKDIKVNFNIPFIYKRTGERYILPEWLVKLSEEDGRLTIVRCEDFGPTTKLIPTLSMVVSPDDIIIVVDDDVVYEDTMVEEHLKHRQKWPKACIGYDGQRTRNWETGGRGYIFDDQRDYWVNCHGKNIYVDILQHYKSVSYLRGFFKNDFKDFWDEFGFWCDDTVISAYMSKHRRARIVTYHESEKHHKDFTLEEWQQNCDRTFPIKNHTYHSQQEGCNLIRVTTEGECVKEHLYKEYIDKGYDDV